MPETVAAPTKVPPGVYGAFGSALVLHLQSRPEVYLKGQTTWQDSLPREHRLPRVVLNAVKRLITAGQRQIVACAGVIARVCVVP